jgi:pilus assembly protein CpaF
VTNRGGHIKPVHPVTHPVDQVVDQVLVRRLQSRVGARRERALEEFRRNGQPIPQGEDARVHTEDLVAKVLSQYESELVEDGRDPLDDTARNRIETALKARLFGAGSLEQLLEDPEVEDISINGWQTVFVHYANGTKAQLAPVASSDQELEEVVQTIAAHDGLSARPFDVVNYDVTLRIPPSDVLPGGARLHAVQGVSATGLSISIRKHRFTKVTLDDLIGQGTLDEKLADFLSAVVRARKNIMIAGAVSAGKTTLLRALAAEIDPEERLITVERAIELGLHEDTERHPDCVALEERLPNVEGVGAVTLAQLVRDSLRMHPSRVIVGEVLGDEVITMLNAMMQGNDGSLSTIHANSSADVVTKIQTYALEAKERLPFEATNGLFAAALDFIVFLRRIITPDGQRRVIESVREVTGRDEDGVKTTELWAFDRDAGRAVFTRRAVRCEDALTQAGWDPEGSSRFSRASSTVTDGQVRWTI